MALRMEEEQVRKGKGYEAQLLWWRGPFCQKCGRPASKRRLKEEVKLEWDLHLMQAVHMETLGWRRADGASCRM